MSEYDVNSTVYGTCGLNHYWMGTHISEGMPCGCGLTTYQSQLTQVLQVLDTYYGDTPPEVIKKLEAILGREDL